MIDQLVKFVIRPPRADYIPSQDLLDTEFILKGRRYQRVDLEVTNSRGHVLQCSHYKPTRLPKDISLPCVIYCHGNSGCRADANEAVTILLPSNITVFTLDFSGSGLSDGDYVSLGWYEKDDLNAVVSYLRDDKQVSCVGLWGRSMGAVTSLLYGAQDPSIAGMVLDSPFSNLFELMLELTDVYKIRLPKFTVKVAVQYMRRIIQKKAQFDIMDLDALKVAEKCFIPALLGHATGDLFIPQHHSDSIYKSYAGDKNIIKFDGDHNSSRPQFYYDSVTIFFYNVLQPPPDPVAEVVADNLYDDEPLDEGMFYEIMNGCQTIPESSSSAIPPVAGQQIDSSAATTEEATSQSRSRWQMSRTVFPYSPSDPSNDITELMRELPLNDVENLASCSENGDHQTSKHTVAGLISNSFQEHSSLDGSFAYFPCNPDEEERMIMEAIAASLGDIENKADGQAPLMDTSSSKLQNLGQRLRSGLFRGVRKKKPTNSNLGIGDNLQG